MKTGLGVYRKYRILIAYITYARYTFKKIIVGFDVANQFIQRVDKYSLMLILRKNGAKIGDHCDIETGLTFHNCTDYRNLIIGNNCHIGKNCFFDLREKVIIDDNVVVSMGCQFITHLDLGQSSLKHCFPKQSSQIHIHNNCYIGADTVLLMGVILSEKVFVAAGSLVNKNFSSLLLVGGIPAKSLKNLIFP